MNHEESKIQQAFIRWCKFQIRTYPELEFIYAIPNGGKRSKAEAFRLVWEGVKAGIPDLHLPVARPPYYSLYMECKTAKGVLSPVQEHVHIGLRQLGNRVEVFRSFDQGVEIVTAYLASKLNG